MNNIVSFSGGKNSTAMLLMMLEDGYKIDDIIFADTGMEYPEMYDYIKKVEKHLDRKITRLKPLKSYYDIFYTKFKNGIYKGNIYGFPSMANFLWCNKRLKLDPLLKYSKSCKNCVMWIGISWDEPKRMRTLIKYKNTRAYLYKNKITDMDCLKYLKDKNLLNPLYGKFKRLGCWCCNLQKIKNLKILRNDYPKFWDKLLELDKDSLVTFKPNGRTVRNLDERFKREDMQLSLI